MSSANPEGNSKVSPFRGDLEELIAQTPQPPYYAVIFTSLRTGVEQGYSDMAVEMVELARQQEGFLGVESARNNVGITVSYWQSVEAIKNWKANARHLFAQQQGRDKWYLNYKVRICRVEHDYAF
ncbi:antibiotic biosynthesis monooxygenase family protein [Mucilaginibacter rubeus]|uniref:antibiotic biosynthesis monooxygenase family protein n=1 Tax=Mucilaginibacter rubeus TaxID=2027860 RepID=UPI00166AD1F1|nr:antibiotic biosynthesis monooxygenase [Mucilaginibacter rubeus]GGB28120.1 polysaccharide biosynthesis protein [Mucilaginibacter rubeus]